MCIASLLRTEMYIRYKRQTLHVAIIDNNIVKTKHDGNKQTQNRQTNRHSQTREDYIKSKKNQTLYEKWKMKASFRGINS